MFVKLNAKEGVKIYPTFAKASWARNRQAKAYKCGVAPKVLSKISKCLVGNLREFDKQDVFITETGLPRVHGYFYKTEVAKRAGRCTKEELDRVESILEYLGFYTEDMVEPYNLGRINGKLVAIDFGKMSSWI